MQPATPSNATRRAFLRTAGAACAAALVGCGTPQAPATRQRLWLRGEARLPHRMQFQGTTVGGLSALDFDPASGLWAALSDDRSAFQPARFYTLRIELRSPALRLELLEAVTLRQANGQPFPRSGAGGAVVDPEGMRLLPGGAGLLWTSEGEPGAGQSPMLRQARLDGSHVRDFETPELLRFGADAGWGPRSNDTFEGLALVPGAAIAWVAMEAALRQDGAKPSVAAAGGPCRFTAFELASGRALRQLAYVPDRVPHRPLLPGGFADNGVAEILMIDSRRMLVLERAYSMGVGTSLRLYEVDTREGSDTLALAKLEPGGFRALPKRLVADFAELGLSRLDNTEGMAWGPPRADGGRTLVLVSDDNFNPLQVTQFVAFDYLE